MKLERILLHQSLVQNQDIQEDLYLQQIYYTYLYFEEMNIDPKNPQKQDRDRFVLSKGHVAPGILFNISNRGFFPVEDLKTLTSSGFLSYKDILI